MKTKKIRLSVVAPMYNEMDNLKAGALEEMYNFLKKQKYTWELLIVDDESTDDSLKFAKKFAKGKKRIKVLAEPHRGKGGTVIAGMLGASGEIVLFTDMDQATPIKEIKKLLPKFDEGYDVVIGSRAGREGAPLIRKVMAHGFMATRTILLRLPYRDTQCGFKAFKKEAARDIFSKMKVFEDKKVEGAAVTAGFDLEFLYIARKLGMKVAEVPVGWRHVGTERVSAVRDSIQAIMDMLRLRVNALKGMYKF